MSVAEDGARVGQPPEETQVYIAFCAEEDCAAVLPPQALWVLVATPGSVTMFMPVACHALAFASPRRRLPNLRLADGGRRMANFVQNHGKTECP